MSKIRVRFAPSPTGYMHVGNFRTALYAYLFAKKKKGDFILRIEDTDQKRFVKDALEKLINILNWAGFDYNEGVFIENGNIIQKGEYGQYIQSERLPIYKEHAQKLIDSGHAYHCFCTPERLKEMREIQQANKQAPMYDRSCLKLSKSKIEEKLKSGASYVIRQKINTDGFTEYVDLIRGKVKIENKLLDDQVLLKSDGYPTYNLANVIDDHLMEISTVIRGDEYVSSTPKYIQLYENFGWTAPEHAHLPLLLNPDKSKLSKRQGDVAVEDYINKGYLKEAIINFVAFLGWNPGEGSTQEIFTLEELIEKFDLTRVHKAGAVFDIKKLDWMNAQWIKKITLDDLYGRAIKFLEQKEFYQSWNMGHGTCPPAGEAGNKNQKEKYLKKVLTIEKDRLEKLSEVGESNKFFFQDINYDKDLLRWKMMSDEEMRVSLEKSFDIISKIDENSWTVKNLEKILMDAADEKPARNATPGVTGGRGELLWPLRVSLTGEKKSPSPFEAAWVLGKAKSLARISNAIKKII